MSIIVESETTRILVDTAPDLRNQFLDNDIDSINAVIWTHDHADHCHGIDDLRAIFHQTREPIAAYARPGTLKSLKNRFAYAFEGHKYYPPICNSKALEKPTKIGDIDVSFVDQPHGSITSAGLCFSYCKRSICYATDFGEVTDEMRNLYQNTDVFVVDALREKPHPTHAHLGLTLDLIKSIKPKLSLLTHMDKSMDYRTLRAKLPETIEPAYDGYQIEL